MNNIINTKFILDSKYGAIYGHKHNLYFYELSNASKESSHKIVIRDIENNVLEDFEIKYQHDINHLKNNTPRHEVQLKLTNEIVDEENFLRIMKKIKQQECKKIVWYNHYYYDLTSNNLKNIIIDAIKKFNHHLFIVWTPDYISITNTPELLLKRDGNQFLIDSIAGTNHNKQVLLENKMQKEQSYVTKHITERLRDLSIDFRVSEKEIIPYYNYYHLKNTIRFESNKSTKELIHNLAPTPAVYSYPYLNKNDFTPLKLNPFYAGTIQIDQGQNMITLVNIRNALIREQKVIITTGCGLVKESQFNYELKESRLKRDSVLKNIFNTDEAIGVKYA